MNKAQIYNEIIIASTKLIKVDNNITYENIDSVVDGELIKDFDFIRLAIKGNILKSIIDKQFLELTEQEEIVTEQEDDEEEIIEYGADYVEETDSAEIDEEEIVEVIDEIKNEEDTIVENISSCEDDLKEVYEDDLEDEIVIPKVESIEDKQFKLENSKYINIYLEVEKEYKRNDLENDSLLEFNGDINILSKMSEGDETELSENLSGCVQFIFDNLNRVFGKTHSEKVYMRFLNTLFNQIKKHYNQRGLLMYCKNMYEDFILILSDKTIVQRSMKTYLKAYYNIVQSKNYLLPEDSNIFELIVHPTLSNKEIQNLIIEFESKELKLSEFKDYVRNHINDNVQDELRDLILKCVLISP